MSLLLRRMIINKLQESNSVIILKDGVMPNDITYAIYKQNNGNYVSYVNNQYIVMGGSNNNFVITSPMILSKYKKMRIRLKLTMGTYSMKHCGVCLFSNPPRSFEWAPSGALYHNTIVTYELPETVKDSDYTWYGFDISKVKEDAYLLIHNCDVTAYITDIIFT